MKGRIQKPVPTTPWLFPEEHAYYVQRLYEFGLLKFSEKRDLKLKSGGYTDIYINLREARSNPEAIRFISQLFAIPLKRNPVDTFVEIPDSVSCFAGPLAIDTDMPYLTIRETEKKGRVGDAKVIGSPKASSTAYIIDDVITDGASKISPYQECLRLGIDVNALIVLVDRQQGWQKVFTDNDIQVPVWPGMTLHDVRREAINLGIIKRCSPEAEAKNPIILACDGKSWEELLPILDELRPTGTILKVNDLLFAKGIDNLLPELSVYGRIMADLKSHDIPNTVGNTWERLRKCPPWAVTVHTSGGQKMIEAGRKELEGTETKILAVTVLTSFDKETCEEIYSRLPLEQVLKFAEIAVRAGADGFVCSPEESPILHQKYPDKIITTPGIRSEGKDKGDQKRIATPKGAIDGGAKHIVMGRQLLQDPNPVAEVKRVMSEELGIQ